MTTIDTINDMKPEWPVTVGTAREADLADDATETTLSSGRSPLSKVNTAATVDEVLNPLDVVGSTNIYDDRGNIRLIPSPPPDPKDPLNLPNWRKYLAIGCLCFFGSLSLCADFVVAGLLPVFLLEYSGVDPGPRLKTIDMKGNPSPLAVVPPGVKPISLYEVTLLSTLPPLSNCVASYFLVPLSLAIGRRPVLLVTAMFSWIGGFWAGFSTTLPTHIAARMVHGLGSATVEALLPLIMQDMVFIHQRNRAIAAILVCQGPLMTVFGIVGPYIAVNYTWRWLYWITSGGGILAWIGLILFVPETRTMRTKAELSGQAIWPIEPGKNRPDLDYETYGKRTLKDDIGMFNRGYEWKEMGVQMLRTLQTSYFPAVVMVVAMDAMFFIVLHSVGQTISFALLAAGIPYELSGLHVITQVLSSAVVYTLSGPLADKLTLGISRWRGQRGREPEYQLPNLFFPVLAAMIGCAVFACAQHFKLHVAVLLTGSFFLGTGSMSAFSILKTFIIESYPHWPGPVLVNVTTFRTLISFAFSSHATTWVQERGPLVIFGIYIAVLFIISGFVPLFYFYGKQFRLWTSGRVGAEQPPTGRHGTNLGTIHEETIVVENKKDDNVVTVENVSGKSVSHVTTVSSREGNGEGHSSKSSL